MSKIEFWYDKPIEVDPTKSWLANSPYLIANTTSRAYEDCPYHKVLSLIEYSRPDFTLTVDGEPILCCESTKENPSGNNLPQRFPGILRPAELGVPAIFYFLKYAKKSTTSSKTNPPLNFNVRVPLAQLRISEIYNVPSMSVFMPTDPKTLLATSNISDHKPLADLVETILKAYLASGKILSSSDSLVLANRNEQIDAVNKVLKATKGRGYYQNPSYRSMYANGSPFIASILSSQYSIDPPDSCEIVDTDKFLQTQYKRFNKTYSRRNQKIKTLLQRSKTFVYQGTANNKLTGPEHPYPGALTMFDILYVRDDAGVSTHDRQMNIAFKLPITLNSYIENIVNKPTGLNILSIFCDIVILDDAIVIAGWMLNLHAGAVLVKL